MKHYCTCQALFLLWFFAPAHADAADLKIAQQGGTVVEVRNVRIGYTVYSFLYTPDFEYTGIRAYQGEGKVTISWSRIAQIAVLGKSNAPGYRLLAEIEFRDGKKSRMDLVESEKGLLGTTDLGAFSIRLHMIKSLEVLKVDK